jgi:hypothetical protein
MSAREAPPALLLQGAALLAGADAPEADPEAAFMARDWRSSSAPSARVRLCP